MLKPFNCDKSLPKEILVKADSEISEMFEMIMQNIKRLQRAPAIINK